MVSNGNDDRNETYCLHKVDVKKFRTTKIWPSSSSSKVKSAGGTKGARKGQSGIGGGGTLRTFDFEIPPPDCRGITSSNDKNKAVIVVFTILEEICVGVTTCEILAR